MAYLTPDLSTRAGVLPQQHILHRFQWPSYIKSQLITDANPHGTITNSALKLAGGILQLDAIYQSYDVRDRTIDIKTVNLGTIFWQRKGSASKNSSPAHLRRLHGMHQRLQEYKRIHGDCRVPQCWEEDLSLGNWVIKQRVLYGKGRLPEDRRVKLDQMDFTWRLLESSGSAEHDDLKWNRRYKMLRGFLEEYGHCDVPLSYEKDRSFGEWVARQRHSQEIGILRQDRKEILDDLGFMESF